jgi:hypothetical protein
MNLSSILIVDPKITLGKPYDLLPTSATTLHVTSTTRAAQYLHDQLPDLVMVSASFSPAQMTEFIEHLKNAAVHHRFLTPLIVVVDLTNRINFVPGTHWAKKFGVLCTLSSAGEVNAVLRQVTAEQKTLGFE